MTFVVPFDGGGLSKVALYRASEFAARLDTEVVAICAIPPNERFAEQEGWPTDPFSVERVAEYLEAEVRKLAPDATFAYRKIEPRPPARTVAARLRKMARDHDADVVFLGSRNAGRLAAPASSVGAGLATDVAYDIYLVRNIGPIPGISDPA